MEKHQTELDDFLTAQSGIGECESSGHFTLARERALSKLGEFQLPSPQAWLLKIAQAAVSLGSRSLDIQQTAQNTVLHFDGPTHWDLDLLEAAFFEPRHLGQAGLGLLLEGLWAASLHHGRPFQLALPGQCKSLFWNGESLFRRGTQEVERLSLTVFHRRLQQGRRMPLVSLLEASRINSVNLSILLERAFTLPIPLTVDGRRLDSLAHCPGYGFHRNGRPFGIGWGKLDLPSFSLPQGTFDSQQQSDSMVGLDRLSFEFCQHCPPQQVGLAWLHTLHFGPPRDDDQEVGGEWRLHEQPSQVFWVRHGVVVSQERLDFLPAPASVALFLSAEGLGLGSDLSGWNLASSIERMERRDQACQFLSLHLPERLPGGIPDLIRKGRRLGWAFGLVGASIGALLAFVFPFMGGTVLSVSGICVVTGGAKNAGLKKTSTRPTRFGAGVGGRNFFPTKRQAALVGDDWLTLAPD